MTSSKSSTGSSAAFRGAAQHPPDALGGPKTFNHVAFEASSEAELAEKRQELLDKGVAVGEIIDHDWCQSIYFRDPNGIELESDPILRKTYTLHFPNADPACGAGGVADPLGVGVILNVGLGRGVLGVLVARGGVGVLVNRSGVGVRVGRGVIGVLVSRGGVRVTRGAGVLRVGVIAYRSRANMLSLSG